MNDYTPDNWVVIEVKAKGEDTNYRILAGWSGGYLDGDSWRLNSGITKARRIKKGWKFYGYSGSCYICRDGVYGLRFNNVLIFENMKKMKGLKVRILDEDTDWSNFDWGAD